MALLFSKIKMLISGSIKRRLYLLTYVVSFILLIMVLVFLWAGNTLTMITAIARFERTHTVSRVEAIVYLHKYNENRDPSDLISFSNKWAITQSYNSVFGSLLEMRKTKTNAEFADIVQRTFAEADRNTAEILVSRIHVLYWHPVIKELVEIAGHAHEQGIRMEEQVDILLHADSPEKKKAAFRQIDSIEKTIQELENRFSYKSGILAAEVASVVNVLSVMMFLFSVGITGLLSYLTIRSISVPMGRFISYLEEVAGGNFAAQIPEISGDELVALNESMTIMLSLNQRLKSEIEEKIQAEDSLKKNNAFLSSIIESPKDIDIISLDLDGCYTAFNANHVETMKQLYGSEVVKGVKLFDLIKNDEDRAQAAKSFLRAAAGGHFTVIQQYGFPGEKKSFEISYNPVFDKSTGEPSGVTLFKVNITERVKLETMLLQAQKMEAIGTLAGGIAHDFNNILGGIVGYAQLASYDIPQNQKAYRYIEQVLTASYRARELVQQILSFSRQTEVEKRPLSLEVIVKEVVKLLRASLPSTIEIVLDIRQPALMINANPTHIHQILMNLCTNAKHAMGDAPGILTICLDQSDQIYQRFFPGLNFSSEQFVIVSVSDTGCGMSAQLINRIFEPYFTTKEKEKGTGLGLSVVHRIIMDHGGAIHVDSEEGKGSSFTIALPRNKGSECEAVEKARTFVPGSGRVLLVDDEQFLVEMEREILEKIGYEVVSTDSSLEALELFLKSPQRFDLLITDMTMPKLTGEMLALKVHETRADIPVILCTGFSESINTERAEKAGIDAILLKPLLIDRFSETIANVLASRKKKI